MAEVIMSFPLKKLYYQSLQRAFQAQVLLGCPWMSFKIAWAIGFFSCLFKMKGLLLGQYHDFIVITFKTNVVAADIIGNHHIGY